MLERRDFLRGGAALGLGGVFMGGVAWSRPSDAVRTILPSASHDTLALKVLLDKPPSDVPVLKIDGREVKAQKMDSDGYAWGFVQKGLKGGTRHDLALTDGRGGALREPWQLSTLPPLDSRPESYRVLFFTCAGGEEALGPDQYLPQAVRRALLDRALSYAPDLAIANGDHVYWDQWTTQRYAKNPQRGAQTAAFQRSIAWIDEDTAFDSDTNRRSVNTIVGRQIAALYEDRFASVPLLFITDDHDYYENDNAGTWGYAFPPRPFTLALQRRTAALAYPFALHRPQLPAYQAETLETVRIGKLLELALFDCRRGWSTDGKGVLFPDVEKLIVDRLRTSEAAQYVHVPSNPFGWSKGALGEWYGDFPPGETPQVNDKRYWQQSWFDQHQRLARALSSQKGRAAVTISGDLHASGATKITHSGDLDLSANPINALLAGTIGTAKNGFPSSARGAFPFTPAALKATDINKLEERNGFTLFDVTADKIVVRQFRWRPPEPVAAIASLEPYDTFTIERPA
ncbi:twin-arginine translocation signal domain-containing protein [Sphingomonas sp.]|uniref:twin-arginine translocation signal domain-containing protein n=1 Tax=Sphingomonas sp. TaxID=28214 RepID=UPI001AFCE9A6|nr:twin-arginine translocation signal domain-containing protein [Sphingomonas sp.]MBO9712389.1 twin-arginine translocation signal domain-containing protein [Sphingomonas sp.]